jgi:hypothetical protein
VQRAGVKGSLALAALPLFAPLYTTIHLPIHYNKTIPTEYPLPFLRLPQSNCCCCHSIQSLDQAPHRHSHRILQFKSWLSNSRARRPSCSTRRRSMLQRLLPMRKRTARMASTLAADLRRPVAIPRDTVSLPVLPLSHSFFPSLSAPPRPNAATCSRHYCCIHQYSPPLLPSCQFTHPSFVPSISSCCATSSDAIKPTPTQPNT